MTAFKRMYEWTFKNLSGSVIGPFEVFSISGLVFDSEGLTLSAVDVDSDIAVGINGPFAVSPNNTGPCAVPGAHWAKVQGSPASGDVVGPITDGTDLSTEGEGFIVVGSKVDGRNLVQVRGEGGPGGFLTRFVLTEYLALDATSATALRLNKDGSYPTVPVEITVTDVNGRFIGYGDYNEVGGSGTSVGFRGYSSERTFEVDVNHPNHPLPGTPPNAQDGDFVTVYDIVEIEKLQPIIVVESATDLSGVGPHQVTLEETYSHGYRIPKGSFDGTMDVYNPHSVGGSTGENKKYVAAYNPRSDQYDLMPGGLGGGGGGAIALIIGEVPAASGISPGAGVGQPAIVPGVLSDGALIIDENGLVLDDGDGNPLRLYVHNFSYSRFVGDGETGGVAATGQIVNGIFVLDWSDMRAGYEYEKAKKQAWAHLDGSEEFELVDFCTESFVHDVRIEDNWLRYYYTDVTDFCTQSNYVDIIQIGPCDTTPP